MEMQTIPRQQISPQLLIQVHIAMRMFMFSRLFVDFNYVYSVNKRGILFIVLISKCRAA